MVYVKGNDKVKAFLRTKSNGMPRSQSNAITEPLLTSRECAGGDVM